MAALSENNTLGISWHDSAWVPLLNQANILDYFAQSNVFYDRSCNNEIIRMQRLNPDQLNNMTGLEYRLLHVQEPILYVIRKQHRHSPTQATPLANYYIINGFVYQAPDLSSVINSRLLNTMCHMNSAFTEAQSYSRYHPSKGYSWEFKDQPQNDDKKDKKRKREEPSSFFQRQRVDVLLGELANKFPPKYVAAGTNTQTEKQEDTKDVKIEVKVEKQDVEQKVVAPVMTVAPQAQTGTSKPPPEKKAKFIR